MSGTINELQYDSVSTYHDSLRIRVGISEGDSLLKVISTENKYQLSNNGSWYSGAQYMTQSGGAGLNIQIMGDNSSQSQWYYNYSTVRVSNWTADGSDVSYEGTVHAKDGNTYVYDVDSNGNTVASATFKTSTGDLVTSNNWAVKHMYTGDISSSSAISSWFQPAWLTTVDGNGGPVTIYSPDPPTKGNTQPNSVRVAEAQSAGINATPQIPLDINQIHSDMLKEFRSVVSSSSELQRNYDNLGVEKHDDTEKYSRYATSLTASDHPASVIGHFTNNHLIQPL